MAGAGEGNGEGGVGVTLRIRILSRARCHGMQQPNHLGRGWRGFAPSEFAMILAYYRRVGEEPQRESLSTAHRCAQAGEAESRCR